MIRSTGTSTRRDFEVSFFLWSYIIFYLYLSNVLLCCTILLLASRIGKLRGLQDELGELPLIPDGVADDDEDHPDMHPSAPKMQKLLQHEEGASMPPDSTGTSELRQDASAMMSLPPEQPTLLSRPRSCYICKRRFRRLVSVSRGIRSI